LTVVKIFSSGRDVSGLSPNLEPTNVGLKCIEAGDAFGEFFHWYTPPGWNTSDSRDLISVLLDLSPKFNGGVVSILTLLKTL